MIGKTLGHYRITEKLGEGDMGVVYKAEDLHLNRFVALKTLPPEKVADQERKQRFTQEAKAASALNHPGILTIHDITSDAGVDFIAMEYVEGKTLDQLIPRKGMRINEALKIGIEIADALAAAHSIGIIHRDIKPSNIMVSEAGRVKILDFGLVKLKEAVQAAASQTTETVPVHTDQGRILGTVHYMSPEQAQGKKVDERSDIFSFGSLLYEMVSGHRPFQGNSSVTTLAAIIEKEPPSLSEEIPAELQKVLARCMRKDPARRYQNAGDVRMELQELKEDSGKLAPGTALHARSRHLLPTALALIALSLVVLMFSWRMASQRSPVEPGRVVPLTTYPGNETTPAFSRDGKQLAFAWDADAGNYDIYVTVLGTSSQLRLTRDPTPDRCPAWSPDGKWIAFIRAGPRPAVMMTPAIGGPERKLAETIPPFYGLTGGIDWSADGEYIAFPTRSSPGAPSEIAIISPNTGERRTISAPPATSLGDMMPKFSPDGKMLAFLRTRSIGPDENYGIAFNLGGVPHKAQP